MLDEEETAGSEEEGTEQEAPVASVATEATDVSKLEKSASELKVVIILKANKAMLGLTFPLEEKAIVPTRSVFILGHVFDKTPRTPPSTADSLIPVITARRQIQIALIGENKLKVAFGQSASVVINLIQGNPPEWLQLIPKGEPILQSHLFAPQLEAAVKRVRDIARDGSAS